MTSADFRDEAVRNDVANCRTHGFLPVIYQLHRAKTSWCRQAGTVQLEVSRMAKSGALLESLGAASQLADGKVAGYFAK